MSSETSGYHIALIGASGGIGAAFADLFSKSGKNQISCFCRKPDDQPDRQNCQYFAMDISQEDQIAAASQTLKHTPPLDLVLITTGLLHHQGKSIFPEKSLKDLSQSQLSDFFLINAIGPALIAKYFIPHMQKNRRSVFAALSARVGSISDNQLGGWHGYRASKSALNMFLKTISIETKRSHPNLIVMGLHPGTVATPLSTPFQKNVPTGKLFTPDFSTRKLLSVLEQADHSYHGQIFDWDNKPIPY